MNIDDLFNKKTEWLKGEGPKSDIVISTRVRIARNLRDEMFFDRADDKQKETALNKCVSALKKCKFSKGASLIKLKDVDEVDRMFLVERHLMSKEHADDVAHKALMVEDSGIASVMLNEEDHIRLQVIRGGFNIMDAWRIVDEIDTEFCKYVSVAYSSRFGYLTSCPTNTGTGLRASVMLHLPALQMTGQVGTVYEAIAKLGLTIRGFYGEGTEAFGNFFQISNQVALGHSEMDILDNLERVIHKIVTREEGTRKYLLENRKQEASDNIFRSLGTLRSARIITSRETIRLLSSVRLGVDLGIVGGIDKETLNELLLISQPAHLQKISGKPLNPGERDIKRADLVREKLGSE